MKEYRIIPYKGYPTLCTSCNSTDSQEKYKLTHAEGTFHFCCIPEELITDAIYKGVVRD